jgi:hypothetical protein
VASRAWTHSRYYWVDNEEKTVVNLHRALPIIVLDVHFISSLPVRQRPACMAWAETRGVQIVGAESYTRPDHDVVDDACD